MQSTLRCNAARKDFVRKSAASFGSARKEHRRNRSTEGIPMSAETKYIHPHFHPFNIHPSAFPLKFL
jgi:hypothetical protein